CVDGKTPYSRHVTAGWRRY
ncbi:hypothetical protein D043_0943B, partial [Vibrio parahaemolyticus EKP-021]